MRIFVKLRCCCFVLSCRVAYLQHSHLLNWYQMVAFVFIVSHRQMANPTETCGETLKRDVRCLSQCCDPTWHLLSEQFECMLNCTLLSPLPPHLPHLWFVTRLYLRLSWVISRSQSILYLADVPLKELISVSAARWRIPHPIPPCKTIPVNPELQSSASSLIPARHVYCTYIRLPCLPHHTFIKHSQSQLFKNV